MLPEMTSAGLGSRASRELLLTAFISRYVHAVRSMWSGLPTLMQEQSKVVADPCFYEESDIEGLLITGTAFNAGFCLSDSEDPRYQKAFSHRQRFGEVLHRAATSIALRQSSDGEDHIDAVITISKAIDVFLLEYGMPRANYDALQKNYSQVRE